MDQKIENSYLRGQLDTATKLEGVQIQDWMQVTKSTISLISRMLE